MFETLLVPTDGSACAGWAVALAADLGQHLGAAVHVLHVVDERHLENAPQHDRLVTTDTRVVDEVVDQLDEAGVEATGAVVTNRPHEGILEYLEEHDVDLVVMGTHGRTGLQRVFLGSVTEGVVRLADVPVATVSHPATDDGGGCRTILLPTDGSEHAMVALPPAVELAKAYGATLLLVSVVEPTAVNFTGGEEVIVGYLEDAAEAALDDLRSRARIAGVADVRTAVEVGPPVRTLRTYVESPDVDLVVMGTHGRSGVARYLLGSVTERLIRTSPVPVVTVPRLDR